MRNHFSDPGEACQPYQDDDDLYDAVEADHQLQGRLHISDPYPGEEETDSHVEVCTNCGAYHSRPTFRCSTCEAL